MLYWTLARLEEGTPTTDEDKLEDGSDLSRREFLQLAGRVAAGLAASAGLLGAFGCDTDAAPTPAPAATLKPTGQAGVAAGVTPTSAVAPPSAPPTRTAAGTASPTSAVGPATTQPPGSSAGATDAPTSRPDTTPATTTAAQPIAPPTSGPTDALTAAPADQPAATKPTGPTAPTPTPEPTAPPETPPAPATATAIFPPMDLAANPYGTGRDVVRSRGGIVATSQTLAVEAGLDALRRGGNAVDAALATAITLAVTEPTSNNLGSDAFALIWDGQKLWGLNGSGRAPAAATAAALRSQGYSTMPQRGWPAVTVPGAPALWRDLHARFGTLPFADLCQQAIDLAQNGYAVGANTAADWAGYAPRFAALRGPQYAGWAPLFLPGGRVPRAGERWSSHDLAASLRRIAATNADDFYSGELARQIAGFSGATGGAIALDDLAAHRSTWVEPIATTYRGYSAWELPPNTQGITTLIGLNILEGFELGGLQRDSARSFHWQIEALKLAFADAFRYVADPDFVAVPVRELLDKGYAARRRALISERAVTPAPGDPNAGGTVYLCTADAGGMMVSFIQSNYSGFGSGIVVPGTGIALHNRGANFALDESHPNCIAPGKRPYHTIIPGFLSRAGTPIGPYGVMGGYMQPQGHIQMLVNTIDYGLNPQASLDAPRWQWVSNTTVAIESNVAPGVIGGLRALGHDAQAQAPGGVFGRGQIIWRMPGGEYVAAATAAVTVTQAGCSSLT